MPSKPFHSKLPNQGLSIFAVMTQMANQYGAINLSQGFPDFPSDPTLIDLVYKHMKEGKNQYAPMQGVPALRQAIADKIKSLYHTEINPDSEITITAGATQALFNTFSAFVSPGDEVIVLDPAYDCYAPAVRLNSGTPVHIPISGPEFKTPWDQIHAAISDKTSVIIFTNPHNPLGKTFKEDDIDQLRQLLKTFKGVIVVDEVYEHLVYDRLPHLSILKYPDIYERCIVTYSFGKTFHNTGWKMGYSVAPPELTKELRKVHQFNVFSVNTPIQHAIAEYMSDASTYLDLPDFFQAKRDLMAEGLANTPFNVLPCEGSYFMLVDYSEVSDLKDTEFAAWLTKEKGVASIPLSPFYLDPPYDKVVRLCFAKSDDTLQNALDKLQ